MENERNRNWKEERLDDLFCCEILTNCGFGEIMLLLNERGGYVVEKKCLFCGRTEKDFTKDNQ